MEAIPASAWLPEEVDSEAPEWSFSLRQLKPDVPELFYQTSQMQFCWRYFNKKGRPVLSADYPEDFAEHIGNAYKKDEPAKPNTIWYVRAWHVGGKRMVVLTVDSFPLMKALKKNLNANPELKILMLSPNDQTVGVSNFYIQLTRDSAPVMAALTYISELHLRPTQNEQLKAEALKPWYPNNYLLNINPLEPAPKPVTNAGVALVAEAANAPVPATPDAPAPAPAAPAEEPW